MELTVNDITLIWESDQTLSIEADGVLWNALPELAVMEHKHLGTIALDSAAHIQFKEIDTGFSKGLMMKLSGFSDTAIALTLTMSIDFTSSDVYASISVDQEDPLITKICWPAPFAFEERTSDHYTLIPHQQGLLIPNTWNQSVCRLPFHGQFCTSDAYMPWFSQFKGTSGYLAIAIEAWDAGYHIDHPSQGPYTHIGVYWLSSLCEMRYTRTLRYTFIKNGDYNTACKLYRAYAKESGAFCTLKEKAVRNPRIEDLIGCMFVHKGIKTHVSKDSDFFDPKQPEKNNSLTTFEKRIKEIQHYHALGVKKLYLHLDGYAQPGYDNQHPDYFPVCEEAGGVKGLQNLFQTIHDYGYLIGLHDQYRDYYHDAQSYHPDMAMHDDHGTIPSHKRWAGGRQSYLCSSIAPRFVKRNFSYLFEQSLYPDASYLDVFTCNEPDECHHPMHRVSRKESLAYREQCFSYLESKGILASSEEANDWALRHLIFAHYGPYPSMMHHPNQPKAGIDVPLFNLVYHECMILPWSMDQLKGQEDQMLYAILNAGAPYLEKDGAYPNTDGVFDEQYEPQSIQDKIKRCSEVCAIQQRLAHCEMISHTFLNQDTTLQKAVYSDGTSIVVDLRHHTYKIK